MKLFKSESEKLTGRLAGLEADVVTLQEEVDRARTLAEEAEAAMVNALAAGAPPDEHRAAAAADALVRAEKRLRVSQGARDLVFTRLEAAQHEERKAFLLAEYQKVRGELDDAIAAVGAAAVPLSLLVGQADAAENRALALQAQLEEIGEKPERTRRVWIDGIFEAAWLERFGTAQPFAMVPLAGGIRIPTAAPRVPQEVRRPPLRLPAGLDVRISA